MTVSLAFMTVSLAFMTVSLAYMTVLQQILINVTISTISLSYSNGMGCY